MHKRIAKKFDKAVFSINTVVNHIANQVAHTRSSSSEVIAIPEVAEEHSNGQEARLIALQALADGDLQSTPLEPPPATPTGLQTKSIDSEIAQKAELAVQAAQDDRSPLAATDELAVDDKSSSSGPPWYFGADFTLLLLIHEARDLPAIDPDTDSCNGFVRVTVGDPDGGSNPVVEGSTRVCYRNRHPQWEESFMFSLLRVREDTRIRLAFYNRNGPGPAAVNPMGHMTTNLGYLLGGITGEGRPLTRWFRLNRRGRANMYGGYQHQRSEGDVCCSVVILSRSRAEQLRPALVNYKLLSPASLVKRTRGFMLQVTLHQIKVALRPRSDVSAAIRTLTADNLSVDVKIGRTMVNRVIAAPDVAASPDGSSLILTLKSIVILVPLAESFQEATIFTSKRSRDEVGDVKVYLLGARKSVLARTQVPIWDIPTPQQLTAQQAQARASATNQGRGTASIEVVEQDSSGGAGPPAAPASQQGQGASEQGQPTATNGPISSPGPQPPASHVTGCSSFALLGVGFGLEPGSIGPLVSSSYTSTSAAGSAMTAMNGGKQADASTQGEGLGSRRSSVEAASVVTPGGGNGNGADACIVGRMVGKLLTATGIKGPANSSDPAATTSGGGGGGGSTTGEPADEDTFDSGFLLQPPGTGTRSSQEGTGATAAQGAPPSSAPLAAARYKGLDVEFTDARSSAPHLTAGMPAQQGVQLSRVHGHSASGETPHEEATGRASGEQPGIKPALRRRRSSLMGSLMDGLGLGGGGRGSKDEGTEAVVRPSAGSDSRAHSRVGSPLASGDNLLLGSRLANAGSDAAASRGAPIKVSVPGDEPYGSSAAAVSSPGSFSGFSPVPPPIGSGPTALKGPSNLAPKAVNVGRLSVEDSGSWRSGRGVTPSSAKVGQMGGAGTADLLSSAPDQVFSPPQHAATTSMLTPHTSQDGRSTRMNGALGASGTHSLYHPSRGVTSNLETASAGLAAGSVGVLAATTSGQGLSSSDNVVEAGAAVVGQGASGNLSTTSLPNTVNGSGGGGGGGQDTSGTSSLSLAQGKRYRRVMEGYGVLGAASGFELEASLLLVPEAEVAAASAAAAAGARPLSGNSDTGTVLITGNDDDDCSGSEDDDDIEDEDTDLAPPKPISFPTPLEIVCTDSLLMARPDAMFDALFHLENDLFRKAVAREGLSGVSATPWAPGQSAGGGRSLTYERPVNVPFLPKSVTTTEEQKIVVQEAGGWLVDVRITTTAPKGDCFFVQMQWACTAHGTEACRLRISFLVKFTKSAGIIQGPIHSGSISSTKKSVADKVADLVAVFGQAPADVGAVTKRKQGRAPGASSKGGAANAADSGSRDVDVGTGEAQAAQAGGPRISGGFSETTPPRGFLSWLWPWSSRHPSSSGQPPTPGMQARLTSRGAAQGAVNGPPAMVAHQGMLQQQGAVSYVAAPSGLSCAHQWVRTLALLMFAAAALLMGLGVLALGGSALLLAKHLVLLMQQQQQNVPGEGSPALYSLGKSLLRLMLQEAGVSIPDLQQ